MRWNIGCFALLFVGLLLGCGADESSDDEGCAHDKDCKGDRICEDGVCISSSEQGSSTGGEGGQGGQGSASDAGVETEGEDSQEYGDEVEGTDVAGAADEAGGAEVEVAELCSNTCPFSSDGDCDDCGPGSDYSFCDIGTDCADCGPRSGTDSCVSAGGSEGFTTCECNCYCSGCRSETTRSCGGADNSACQSCTVVCRDVCAGDPLCGSYLSSSGSCS